MQPATSVNDLQCLVYSVFCIQALLCGHFLQLAVNTVLPECVALK